MIQFKSIICNTAWVSDPQISPSHVELGPLSNTLLLQTTQDAIWHLVWSEVDISFYPAALAGCMNVTNDIHTNRAVVTCGNNRWYYCFQLRRLIMYTERIFWIFPIS